MKHFVVVSYDISSDRRRLKVMKIMEGFGERVQYSVFECRLTEGQVRELRRRLLRWVNPREDSVRFYFLSRADVARIRVLGLGAVTPEKEFYVV